MIWANYTDRFDLASLNAVSKVIANSVKDCISTLDQCRTVQYRWSESGEACIALPIVSRKEAALCVNNRSTHDNGQHAPSVCVSERAAYALKIRDRGMRRCYRPTSASAQHSLGFIASAKREVPETKYKNESERKQEIARPNKPGRVVSHFAHRNTFFAQRNWLIEEVR